MKEAAEIIVTQDDGVTTIVCRGELDLSHADGLTQLIDGAVDFEDDVAVDLRQAKFIDTAILACLAKAAKMAKENGRSLKVLVSPNSHPLYVLETVGFSAIMDIVPEDIFAGAQITSQGTE